MSIIDIPLDTVPPDQLAEHVRRLREYLRTARDPNEAWADGHTCTSIAVRFCSDGEGVIALHSLLERGGDPNRPSALQNFVTYLMVAKSLRPLEDMIAAGLKLHDTYRAETPFPSLNGRPVTMLDYVLEVQAYMNGKRKPLSTLAKKNAGGLGGRLRLLSDIVALLEFHGAGRAKGMS